MSDGRTPVWRIRLNNAAGGPAQTERSRPGRSLFMTRDNKGKPTRKSNKRLNEAADTAVMPSRRATANPDSAMACQCAVLSFDWLRTNGSSGFS